MPAQAISAQQAFLILNALPHAGPISTRRLLDAFNQDPLAVLSASKKELYAVDGIGEVIADTIQNWESKFDLDREEERMAAHGVKFISQSDTAYPSSLKHIYDYPLGLYAKGDYRPKEKSIAIVGSRRCTIYGTEVAKRLASELANLGFCVVSGMARGIDTAAHEGALSVGGKTAAVLGCGVDIVYPPENKDLYNRIAETGVVFSEFTMGRRADKQTFPMRNRLVSGMSQAVIVVETDERGGSMITAGMAAEQGRQVYAVPGRIDQASARGCHKLIRDGVPLLTCVDDILEDLNYLGQLELSLDNEEKEPDLTADELEIWKTLRETGGTDIDNLVSILQKPSPGISSTLLMLELKKLVVKKADGSFEAIRPS